jgi:hypothetical protein
MDQEIERAIEAIPVAEPPMSMSSFPAGACGDVCLLLGTYLAECGEEGFLYICGERGSQQDRSWMSHAWLDRDGLIIDITADQFPDAPAGVIVERNSVWHQRFQCEDDPEPSDFRKWHGPTYHLHAIYPRLKQWLDPHIAKQG